MKIINRSNKIMKNLKKEYFISKNKDWTDASQNIVSRRIFELFGFDSYFFLYQLSEIYRKHSDDLAQRYKGIRTKKDLLNPREFENIIRFRPDFFEKFDGCHILPYEENIDWYPQYPVPSLLKLDALPWGPFNGNESSQVNNDSPKNENNILKRKSPEPYIPKCKRSKIIDPNLDKCTEIPSSNEILSQKTTSDKEKILKLN